MSPILEEIAEKGKNQISKTVNNARNGNPVSIKESMVSRILENQNGVKKISIGEAIKQAFAA